MSKRAVLASLALFCAAEALLLVRITVPHAFVFDEIFYVPAARALLAHTANLNPQHPPLGKYLIALGIGLFGDRPLGWRVISALFGGFTVVGLYGWARALLLRHDTAVWIASIALCSQLLFIHARAAMLEIFLACFIVWGVAAFCAATNGFRPRAMLVAAGAMFGLASAVKWFGLIPWAVAGIWAVAVWATRRAQPRHTPPNPTQPGLGAIVLALVVVPAAVYVATFLPLFWLPGSDATWRGFWLMQARIWQEHIYAGPPVQMTRWWQWPVNTRPMWFWYEREGNEWARVVALVGNPVLLWGGLAAMIACAWDAVRTRSRAASQVAAWYAALWLSWAAIPRSTTFFYYYLPASTALLLALGYCVERWPDHRVFTIRWKWLFAAAAAIVFAAKYPTATGMRVAMEWLPK